MAFWSIPSMFELFLDCFVLLFDRANASCIWLKDNLDSIDSWYVDIIRYDCENGCGFDSYWNGSVEMSGDSIGGTCSENTGECDCWTEFLFDDCTESCPGLLGPFWNELSKNFTFEYCSGHGSCDIDTKTCNCDLGYGNKKDNSGTGNDCSYKYPKYSYNEELFGIFVFIFVIIIIVLIASLIWLKSNLQYKVKRFLV